MVGKLSLLRDLLHKLADFITDFMELLSRFRELFGKEEVKENEEVREDIPETSTED